MTRRLTREPAVLSTRAVRAGGNVMASVIVRGLQSPSFAMFQRRLSVRRAVPVPSEGSRNRNRDRCSADRRSHHTRTRHDPDQRGGPNRFSPPRQPKAQAMRRKVRPGLPAAGQKSAERRAYRSFMLVLSGRQASPHSAACPALSRVCASRARSDAGLIGLLSTWTFSCSARSRVSLDLSAVIRMAGKL